MSWGWMAPGSVNRVLGGNREGDDKTQPGTLVQRTITVQMPGPWNQTGNTFSGIKPGFPLGYEPNYDPDADTRYDWPCRGEWSTSTGVFGEGEDSPPP